MTGSRACNCPVSQCAATSADVRPHRALEDPGDRPLRHPARPMEAEQHRQHEGSEGGGVPARADDAAGHLERPAVQHRVPRMPEPLEEHGGREGSRSTGPGKVPVRLEQPRDAMSDDVGGYEFGIGNGSPPADQGSVTSRRVHVRRVDGPVRLEGERVVGQGEDGLHRALQPEAPAGQLQHAGPAPDGARTEVGGGARHEGLRLPEVGGAHRGPEDLRELPVPDRAPPEEDGLHAERGGVPGSPMRLACRASTATSRTTCSSATSGSDRGPDAGSELVRGPDREDHGPAVRVESGPDGEAPSEHESRDAGRTQQRRDQAADRQPGRPGHRAERCGEHGRDGAARGPPEYEQEAWGAGLAAQAWEEV